jgi:hypothetical protein
LKESKARLGAMTSRRGLCNSPHPDPKYRETVMAPDPTGRQIRNEITGKLETVYVEAEAATVKCSRFADHEGDCSAYAFSIIAPDTWPKPVDA